jgi:T-complex protein 1 subunit theta
MQEEECGDATNFVVTLAGEFLSHAENLIRMGLHPSQIVIGYEQASKKALALLADDSLISYRVEDVYNHAQVSKALLAPIAAKVPNYATFLSELVAKACINSTPDTAKNFDIDNIRVVHILGSSLEDSTFLSGFLVKRNAEGCIDRMVKPRIAVYSCPLDTMQAETKGTVLIQNASELLNYSKGEEDLAEKFVQKLVNANINVVVSGGSVADIVLHFLDKYKIMVVRILSKFELRRVARAVRATILSKLEAPTPEEIGTSDDVAVQEIASERVVIFRRDTEDCKLSTIVLRGSTNNILEDIERAIDDGVHVFRSLIKDPVFVPGAGSFETVLVDLDRSSASGSKLKARSSLDSTSTVSVVLPSHSKCSPASWLKTAVSTPTSLWLR